MPADDFREALPDRYEVRRNGTPDPGTARYYVVDVMHDRDAREVLRLLVNKYRRFGPSSKADQLERLLDESDAPFGELIKARAQAQQALANKNRTRAVKAQTVMS